MLVWGSAMGWLVGVCDLWGWGEDGEMVERDGGDGR